MSTGPIYLDHNGTTPVDAEVLDAMLPFLREHFGNPSSTTSLGHAAREAIETARAEVASLIGATASEIIFTGGGTEASNHAIRGFAAVAPPGRRTIVTSTVEHPATEMPCRRLEREGFAVKRIPVDRDGVVDVGAARDVIGPETALVTIIHAQMCRAVTKPSSEAPPFVVARAA
ncbi:MAG: aminotransferase class V-fold PLP-dependent enzyme [Beijerinckiaceae bacterium]|jgi:cysteine desulfurase|nr:aminotransferase class V-fold PLP-dependent enzyme [Beijerinckiaceae bacterium]